MNLQRGKLERVTSIRAGVNSAPELELPSLELELPSLELPSLEFELPSLELELP